MAAKRAEAQPLAPMPWSHPLPCHILEPWTNHRHRIRLTFWTLKKLHSVAKLSRSMRATGTTLRLVSQRQESLN